jgi:hypothetical protein
MYYAISIVPLVLQDISLTEKKKDEVVGRVKNRDSSCCKDYFNEFYSAVGEMLLTSLAQ